MCGPYYAPFIYSSHRYASTFQSAEALARTVLDTREKPRRQHRERVEAVMAVLEKAQLDAEIAGWAMRVLQGRNDKPLRQLMEELISSAGDVGRELLATVPDLAGLLASARTSVSHPGAEGPDALARYWLGEALIWVLRVRLLAELGVPVSDLSARVIQKPAFQNILRELASFQPSPGKPGNGLARWRRWLHRTMSLLRRFFRWWRAGRAVTLFTNPRQDCVGPASGTPTGVDLQRNRNAR